MDEDDNGLPMALFGSLTHCGNILLLLLFMWDYVAKVHNMRLKSARACAISHSIRRLNVEIIFEWVCAVAINQNLVCYVAAWKSSLRFLYWDFPSIFLHDL